MIEPLTRVRIRDVGERRAVAWAEGLEVSLPKWLADAFAGGRAVAGSTVDVPVHLDPVALTEAATLRERAAFTDKRPASARTPISYQHVPGRLRAMGASIVGRWKRRRVNQWAAFPGWPLDLSADFLADLGANPLVAPRDRCPVMLSHDLDSPEGLSNLMSHFLPIEETAGARSTNFIVPCAWPIDHARLQEISERGHEIGVHGYDHSNRTPFATPAERIRRLDAARPLVERYRITGYRAPSLLRTRELLRDLAGRYCYDSSIPTSGGLFPVPNSGCATARPFTIEGITEIPVTLPRDGSLRFLGYGAGEIADLWINLARVIASSGGVVMLLTHCEARFSGTPQMLDAYRRFVEFIAQSSDFTWARPADIARGLHT